MTVLRRVHFAADVAFDAVHFVRKIELFEDLYDAIDGNGVDIYVKFLEGEFGDFVRGKRIFVLVENFQHGTARGGHFVALVLENLFGELNVGRHVAVLYAMMCPVETRAFDVVIIGSGPGGCEAARIIGAAGKSVALVEKHLVGGECLHYGCIPSKVYLHTSHHLQFMRSADQLGITADGVRLDFGKLVARRKRVVEMLHRGLTNSLTKAGVSMVMGEGVLVEPHAVRVTASDGSVMMLQAEYVILAAGSGAAVPSGWAVGGGGGAGVSDARVMTNRELFALEKQPESLLIIGGGTVGCEMASFFSAIGTKVTIVEQGQRLLSREDEAISGEFARLLGRHGVEVLCNTSVTALSSDDMGVRATVQAVRGGGGDSGARSVGEVGEVRAVAASHALIAVGRRAAYGCVDWEHVPIARGGAAMGGSAAGANATDGGPVQVNDFMQTSLSHVYAIGDFAGKSLLAYSAEREGEIAAYHIVQKKMDEHLAAIDYDAIPSEIFTHPEIASVGLSEARAHERGVPIKIGQSAFSLNSKALILGERDGFVKVIAHAKTGVVLGVHIIGPNATLLIDKATLGVSQRLTAAQMLKAVAGHPVTSETLEMALEAIVE